MPSSPASGQTSEAKSAEDRTDDGLSRLSELAWQALPAIGSAIGFAGFVAIIGAAIEWVRFDTAHLPATQALLAVPKPELVIIGALALGVFVLGAVLAVLAVYLIESHGNATPGTARGLVAIGVIEMLITLVFIHTTWWGYALLVLWLVIFGLAAAKVAGEVMRNLRSRTALKQARMKLVEARETLAAKRDASNAVGVLDREAHNEATAQAQAQLALLAAEREWARAVGRWLEATDTLTGQLPAGADNDELKKTRALVAAYGDELSTVTDLERLLEDAERGTGHVFRAVGLRLREQVTNLLGPGNTGGVVAALIQFVLASTIAGIVLVATNASFSWILILLGVVVVLTGMNVLVARATDKFAWYGISVFFSVLMFGGALTIARTLDEPKVQPVALVRKGDDVGICGVFITQTSERVYVGRLALEGDRPSGSRPGLIFWVLTSDIDLVSVGQPERIDGKFPKLAAAMLARLYADRAEQAAPSLKNTTVTKVLGTEVKAGFAGKQTTIVRETPPRTTRPSPYPEEKVGADCTSSSTGTL
jgi:hypothetical protein